MVWVVLFVASLVPAFVALGPGVSRVVFNFTDPNQQPYLTPGRIALLLFILLAVLAPFLTALLMVIRARRRGHSWAASLRAGSAWAFGLGLLSATVVMYTGGGF